MQKIEQEACEKLNSLLEKGGQLPCQQCKGSGKITLTCSTFGKPDSETKCELTCISCSGHGQHDLSKEEDRSAWVSAEIERTMWCKCEEDTDSYYMDDNECECCIGKHHYHCENCDLITQIG